ncbi:MAG: transglutaminase family protein [Opitutaceae bacterium]|jgi:transglutaminase-like putative cysteine protease
MKRLIFFLLCVALARADRLPEWLKLPAADDPRPSDVSAWVLHDAMRITQNSPDTIVYNIRHAVMPLSAAGVRKTVCELVFSAGTSKLVLFKAWAMSPDGKKCRAFGGSEFLVYSPTVSNWVWDLSKSVYFKPERFLQPGWIFAYELEIKSESAAFDVHWSPRSSLPVRFASLDLVPMEGGTVKWKAFSRDLPQPQAMGARGALAWRIFDLPGSDQSVPLDMEHNSMELRAYLLASETETETKSWSDVVRLVRAEMDPKAIITPEVAAEAKRLAGSGDFWSRILPVCQFVQKGISYLNVTIDSDVMAGYRPHAAGEVLGNRYGDCKDKAVLLCTMLGFLGVEARVMLVNSGHPMRARTDWPSAYFNHAIVAIPCREAPPAADWTTVHAGSEDYVLFDPTHDFMPLGLLPQEDRGGLGLILAPDVTAPVVIPMPLPKNESRSNNIDITLAENGSAKVAVTEERIGLSGAEAMDQEETVALDRRMGRLEKAIQQGMPFISDLTIDSTSDASARKWNRTARFSAQFVGKRIPGGGMYVLTDLMSLIPSTDPWDAETEGWFNFMPGTLKREIRIAAPAGWSFAEIPEDWTTKTDAGECEVRYRQEDGIIKGEVRLRIEGGILDRKAYLELRDLLRAATAAERRPLMLIKTKPTAVPAQSATAAPAAR